MGLVAINQYHLTYNGQTMFYYGTEAPTSNTSEWILDGVAFYGCEEGDSDAVPVLIYYAPCKNGPTKYCISTEVKSDGWYPYVPQNSTDNIAFYAYSVATNGAMPVYELQVEYESLGTFYWCGNYPGYYLADLAGAYPTSSSVAFYAVPGNAVLNYAQESFSIVGKLPPLVPTVFCQEVLTNQSSNGTLQTSYTFEYSTTAQYSWGLTQQINIQVGVSIQIKIPFVAKTTISTNVGGSFGGNEQWTHSETQDLSMEVTATAGPGQSVVCKGIVMMQTNEPIDFTITFNATAQTNTAPTTVQTLPQSVALALYDLTNPQPPSGIPAPEIEMPAGQDYIQVTLDGAFQGSFADSINASLEDATDDQLTALDPTNSSTT